MQSTLSKLLREKRTFKAYLKESDKSIKIEAYTVADAHMFAETIWGVPADSIGIVKEIARD